LKKYELDEVNTHTLIVKILMMMDSMGSRHFKSICEYYFPIQKMKYPVFTGISKECATKMQQIWGK